MPLFAYRCSDCQAGEEHIQKHSDAPIDVCDACGGALRKLITGTNFALKGGGWYKDGYTKKPDRRRAFNHSKSR